MMKFILERVTDPVEEVIGLSEMKRAVFEFEDVHDRDADVGDMIRGSREWLEDFTGRALVDQQWRLTIDQHGRFWGAQGLDSVRFPRWYGGSFFWGACPGEIRLRKSPILAITSFKTYDADGVETDVSNTSYEVREADSKWPRVVPINGATWWHSSLRITFRAGFCNLTGSPVDSVGVVPVRFKQAMKLWARANYDCDSVEMDKYLAAATNLIKSERAELSIA